tara:strand:+ start:386 stop:700 length:315 start_codon:yes stop_codon:yes gene_type:complete
METTNLNNYLGWSFKKPKKIKVNLKNIEKEIRELGGFFEKHDSCANRECFYRITWWTLDTKENIVKSEYCVTEDLNKIQNFIEERRATTKKIKRDKGETWLIKK